MKIKELKFSLFLGIIHILDKSMLLFSEKVYDIVTVDNKHEIFELA